MCNYSEFLIEQGMEKGMEKGIKKGRKEGMKKGMEKGMEKGKLDFLEQLEADHFSDIQIMRLLRVNATQLKSLRKKLTERKQSAMISD